MRPGNGDIPVYSPIDVNATLQSEFKSPLKGFNYKFKTDNYMKRLVKQSVYTHT